MMHDVTDFDAVEFFSRLTQGNRLAREYDFRFSVVSGLEGFEDALHQALDATAIIAVDDSSQADVTITNTPRKRDFRVVYMFMRHSTEGDWALARKQCFSIMREIFRQFCSVIIRERTRLRLENTIIGEDITFHEIDRYFFTGGACAWFQIDVTKFISLELNSQEWLENPIPQPKSRLDVNTPRPSTIQ